MWRKNINNTEQRQTTSISTRLLSLLFHNTRVLHSLFTIGTPYFISSYFSFRPNIFILLIQHSFSTHYHASHLSSTGLHPRLASFDTHVISFVAIVPVDERTATPDGWRVIFVQNEELPFLCLRRQHKFSFALQDRGSELDVKKNTSWSDKVQNKS